MKQIPIRSPQIFSLKDDVAYIITYTAETLNYDRYLSTAQKMIDSFQTVNATKEVNRTAIEEAEGARANDTRLAQQAVT